MPRLTNPESGSVIEVSESLASVLGPNWVPATAEVEDDTPTPPRRRNRRRDTEIPGEEDTDE